MPSLVSSLGAARDADCKLYLVFQLKLREVRQLACCTASSCQSQDLNLGTSLLPVFPTASQESCPGGRPGLRILERDWAGCRREQGSSAPDSRRREEGKGGRLGRGSRLVSWALPGAALGRWGDRGHLSTLTSHQPIISCNYLEKIH